MSDFERPGQSGSEIEAAASGNTGEEGSESEDEADDMGWKGSEILFCRQPSTGNVRDVEDETTPTLLNPPLASPTPGLATALPLDASSDNPFTVDAPETRTGRKRKTRDLHAILAVCTCGDAVSESEITRDENVIECRRTGCETGWVSEIDI